MGNIIRLPRDQHEMAQLLLPWFATGRLDAADHARVTAHLRTCAKCQADLRVERRLESEVAGLTLDVEEGWAAMRRRLDEPLADDVGARLGAAGRAGGVRLRAAAPWMGWALAAGVALFAVVGWLSPPAPTKALYHTLAAAPPPAGDAIVMFRPDTSQQAMSEALTWGHARIVDGPTSTGAYVLTVPAAGRAATLAALRRRRDVVMAEPIGDGGRP
ncbi:MAG TPA: zf-HC2 domain-containing protein [Caulobacteraceae bacterium]|jgi:hypothetical protein